MKKQDYTIPISVVISFVLISISIYFSYGLDNLQKIFSILGSLSIWVALLTYFNKKKQDEILSTIDQITFFREKIIPEWSDAQKYIIDKKPGFIFSMISLEKPTIEDVRRDFSVNFERQSSLFLDVLKNYPDIYIDNEVLKKQVFLLNMLEEFSLKVIHLGTSSNPALESVHNVFIEIVENNAFALLFMREIWTSNPIYSSILSLYDVWKNKIKEHVFIIKTLEKHGLIDEKQRKAFYKVRRDKSGF